ncbi:hypothetical protein LSH36_298g02007 [Paralvinella palmiformis]|uniref:Glycosyltransferase family 92 protein n=1 Tax=Paralvinella palmiformis TaxID=53620 RepID=A0AAD9JI41_9ANNE|nr:hypothetical protein LSH36_298g02007 [Paralvinella palmiformis]
MLLYIVGSRHNASDRVNFRPRKRHLSTLILASAIGLCTVFSSLLSQHNKRLQFTHRNGPGSHDNITSSTRLTTRPSSGKIDDWQATTTPHTESRTEGTNVRYGDDPTMSDTTPDQKMEAHQKHSVGYEVIAESNQTGRCQPTRPKPKDVTRLNTNWQVFAERDVYISMYSAYFDRRSILNDSSSFVYVNAAAKQLSKSRNDEAIAIPVRSPYYCQLWYESRPHPDMVVMTFVRNEFLRAIDGVTYSTYTLACPIPGGHHRPVPSHVSIVYNRCDPATTYLSVSDASADGEEHEFGICTAVGFGRLPVDRMVEWFEFHRLLGVTEFNIYSVNMRGLKRVFAHYEDIGVLRVHATTSPLTSWYVASIRLASQVVLNDCMMRNRKRYRYVVIVDFDEIMWPNRPGNFSALLGRVNAAQDVILPCISYTFHNAYHILTFPEDADQPWYLRTMRFRFRHPPTPMPAKSKSIVDPRMCIIVYHHACILPADPELRPATVVVDPELAMSHHYRECPPHLARCDVIPQRPDDLVLQYKEVLISRVRPILRKVGLF